MTRDPDGGWRIGRRPLQPAVPDPLREWVEHRVQLATEQANAAQAASVAALLAALRESNEQRIQIATCQAMSHADQGVGAIATAMKGFAKALAGMKRQDASSASIDAELANFQGILDKIVEDQNRLDSSIISLQKQIDRILAQIESTKTGSDNRDRSSDNRDDARSL